MPAEKIEFCKCSNSENCMQNLKCGVLCLPAALACSCRLVNSASKCMLTRHIMAREQGAMAPLFL